MQYSRGICLKAVTILFVLSACQSDASYLKNPEIEIN